MSNQNDQPKTRPLDPGKSLDDLFPNRFLKAENLIAWGVTSLTVTIAEVREEEVKPQPTQPAEWKTVLYFKTRKGVVHPQGYLLSAKVDKDSIKSATGASTIGELLGKQIVIQLDEYKKESVLRISPQPVPAPAPAPSLPEAASASRTSRLTASVSFLTQSPCTASIRAISTGPVTFRRMRSSI